MTDIIPNFKKMGFVNHDLHKFQELKMYRYMMISYGIKDGPIHMVLMEWERGLDKVILLSLMYMLHFGCTIEVNAHVKQLLVCVNGRFYISSRRS